MEGGDLVIFPVFSIHPEAKRLSHSPHFQLIYAKDLPTRTGLEDHIPLPFFRGPN